MITRKDGNINLQNAEDIKYLKAFERITKKYCKDNKELWEKIFKNFLNAFNAEEDK